METDKIKSKILIIDDSKTVSDSVCHILKKNNILSDVAYTGKEAIDLLSKTKYNLILLDLILPDIDGENILKLIRKEHSLDDLPVIVLSSITEEEKVVELLEFGANDFITKPFSELILKLKLKIFLELQNKSEKINNYNKTLKDIIDNTPILSVIIDDDVKVLSANNSFLKYFDSNQIMIQNTLLGNVVKCIHSVSSNGSCGKMSDCLTCLFRTTVIETINTGKNIFKREGQFKIKTDGVERLLFLQISTTRIIYNNNQAILLSINDITKEKEQNIQLQKLNITKDKFISIISHDLKNPIAGFMGVTELLYQNYSKIDNSKIEELLYNLYDTSKKTYALLENLLTWTRTQSEDIVLKKEKIRLYDLSKDILRLFEVNFKSKKLNQFLEIDENILVSVDKNMLNTVLRNLIMNSIKFTNESGNITLKAEVKNDLIEISVIDTGIGIPDKIKDSLFKLDEKTTRPGTKNETGTGLGLILCKEFVEKHGGKIWVISSHGKGSVFKFTLPN